MSEYKVFFDYVQQFKEINEEERKELKSVFTPKTFKKGELITEYGKPSSEIVFILDGYIRVFVIDLEGNEVTIYIKGKSNFIGAITSFITRQPSEEYVQAVTDVEVLAIKYQDLADLYEASHTWAKAGLHVMEDLFMDRTRRMISFIKKTAEDRYRYMLENEADMLLHVPLSIMASYLGMKPETMSRIRARIS